MAMLSVRAAPIADSPAVASYLALVLCMSCGMAASARGPHRWGWLLSVAVIVAGLTLTGSRAAFAGVAIGVVIALVIQRDRPRDYVKAGVLAGILAFVIAGVIAWSAGT